MKIAFISMSALLDPSNGAAQSVRVMLEHAARRGHIIKSMTAATFDKPPANHIDEILKISCVEKVSSADDGQNHINHRGVSHHLVAIGELTRSKASRTTELAVFDHIKNFLSSFHPDIVLTFGGGPLVDGLKVEAKKLKIPIVMYLVNPSYTEKKYFDDFAAIFTDTAATQKLYYERFGLTCHAIGKFIDFTLSPNVVGEKGMITFINPILEKGATLFYRIAHLAETALPDVRFLVVESRGSLEDLERAYNLNFSTLRNIRTVGLLKDLNNVFDRTKILLLPSVWHESGPRIIVEAMARGIPMIAHDIGGIAEIAGDAAIYVEPPSDLIKNFARVPSATAAIPWIEAIRILLKEKDIYDSHRAAALKNAQLHDPEKNIDRVLYIFETLLKN